MLGIYLDILQFSWECLYCRYAMLFHCVTSCITGLYWVFLTPVSLVEIYWVSVYYSEPDSRESWVIVLRWSVLKHPDSSESCGCVLSLSVLGWAEPQWVLSNCTRSQCTIMSQTLVSLGEVYWVSVYWSSLTPVSLVEVYWVSVYYVLLKTVANLTPVTLVELYWVSFIIASPILVNLVELSLSL